MPPKATKSNWNQLISLFESKVRYEIISRHMDLKNIETLGLSSDPFTLKLQMDNEIMEFLFGSSDLVRLGLQWGILKEHPKKTKKKKAKKLEKEMKGFF